MLDITFIHKRSKPVPFGLAVTALAALTGLVIIRSVLAAPSVIKFEVESGSLSGAVAAVNDASASGGKALQFGQSTSSKTFIHPGVVYTQAEIDAWSTSSPEYSRLAGTCAGTISGGTQNCINRSTPIAYGTRIDCGGRGTDVECELNKGLKDQSGFAKVQALLWAADNNNARRSKVIAYLQEYRSVTGFEDDSVQQWRLVAGWACTNLAQAAEIINYQDAQFKRFLRDVCYPVMDWPTNPNWQASFADSKLAIAAYLGDEELWNDAKAYFYRRIKQSIYHSAHDGSKVHPIYSQDTVITNIYDGAGNIIGRTVPPRLPANPGPAHLGRTRQQWGGSTTGGKGQINDDYTLNTDYAPIVDGINAERLRDLGHVNMSYTAWINAARTIRAQGEQLEQQAYDRLLAGWGYHAERVLAFVQTGTMPAPDTYQGDGGGARFMGYFPARRFFGSATPASILSMIQRSEVRTSAAAGALHIVGEAFTDNQ